MATLVVTGRLGKDAELKTLQSDTQVATWSMAYDTGFGERKKSHWVKCAMFGKRGASLAQVLMKGMLVEVTGEPTVAVWSDKKTKEPRGQIELTVTDVKMHGGGERDSGPVADRGRATKGDDGEIPF